METSRSPRLLINFGPLKSGGGHNVALNFMQELERSPVVNFEFFFVVSKDSGLHEMVKASCWSDRIYVVSKNRYIRVLQELFAVRLYIKRKRISGVYSYFGYGLFGLNVKQVVGSADSNLYFPEINFWGAEKAHEKVIRWVVDKFRVFGLKRASGVIFENEAMYDRAERLFGIVSKALILPSIDAPGVRTDLDLNFKTNHLKALLLCGWQQNKNILLIPKLAAHLRSLGFPMEFIITVDADGSRSSKEFFDRVKEFDVAGLVNCVGSVEKGQLPELYEQIDLVLLLSLLESFSNNIIESWFFERPLLVSDEEWSRAICSDAALYVQRDNVDAIAKAIVNVMSDWSVLQALVINGRTQLKKFPSIKDRLSQELKFISEVIN